MSATVRPWKRLIAQTILRRTSSLRLRHPIPTVSAAVRSAKAGQELSEAEMQELFDALFATELPWHDVHGRPTVVRLSNAELERKFGR